jgi:hypothetical protein
MKHHALSTEIAQMVAACNDSQVLQPAKIGQGDWQNELLLFVKPEVFMVEEQAKIEKTLDLVLNKIAEFDAQVDGIAIVGGRVLDRLEIMSQHYGLINRLSRSASKILSEDDKKKISEALNVPIAEYDILGGHEYLEQYPNESGSHLDQLWFEGKSTKIRSGFYIRRVKKGERKVILVNAFHPEQLAHFTNPSHRIALFLIHSNNSWFNLKNQMVGGTFPDKADPESIRGTLYANPQQYGFESVSIANNCVHLSAGPFEALFEIANFFGKILGLNLDDQAPLVIRKMLDQGIGKSQALMVLENPTVSKNELSTDLFTATEDMDTQEAIDLWKKNL